MEKVDNLINYIYKKLEKIGISKNVMKRISIVNLLILPLIILILLLLYQYGFIERNLLFQMLFLIILFLIFYLSIIFVIFLWWLEDYKQYNRKKYLQSLNNKVNYEIENVEKYIKEFENDKTIYNMLNDLFKELETLGLTNEITKQINEMNTGIKDGKLKLNKDEKSIVEKINKLYIQKKLKF